MKKNPESGATAVPGNDSALNPQSVTRLMRLLENTRQEEYSCAETFELLDQYVELVNSGAEAAALMPLVEHHIQMCPECRTHYEILLDILQTETNS